MVLIGCWKNCIQLSPCSTYYTLDTWKTVCRKTLLFPLHCCSAFCHLHGAGLGRLPSDVCLILPGIRDILLTLGCLEGAFPTT